MSFPHDSEVLRASVVDAALELGPRVAGWMFNDDYPTITEDDDLPTPELVSPGSSSDDSHASSPISPILHTPREAHYARLARLRPPPLPISPPTKLIPLAARIEPTLLVNCPSPFLLISNPVPRIKQPVPLPRTPLPPKRTPSISRPLPPKQTNTRTPQTPGPRPSVPSPHKTSESKPKPKPVLPLTRSTSLRTRKPAPEWDFKDPDRPSFFALSSFPTPTADDPGYLSEGTAKTKAQARAKEKANGAPLKRSVTARIISRFAPSPGPRRLPLSSPPPSPTRPDSTTSSFALVPDMNRIARTTSARTRTNEEKLNALATLLIPQPGVPRTPHTPTFPRTPRTPHMPRTPLPPTPRPRTPREPIPPFPTRPRPRPRPIRGIDPPFPTRPTPPSLSHLTIARERIRANPVFALRRNIDVDVPRSVRSTLSGDLEREEERWV